MERLHDHSASRVAVYLADREGLSGDARSRFIRILEEDFQYTSAHRQTPWLVLLACGIAPGFMALTADGWMNHGHLPLWLWIGWPCFAGAGALMALALRHAKQRRDSEPDLQWRVYCILVRPMIASDNPGLLDRNLPLHSETVESLSLTPLTSVRLMIKDPMPGQWRAALVGLWIGSAALFVLRTGRHSTNEWMICLPAAGIALCSVFWATWQWIAFRAVSDDPRIRDGDGPT